jgi:hypothetical protein
MNADIVDDVINEAVHEIRQLHGCTRPTDIAKLVGILHRIHTDGYGHGLHQGHYDRDHPEG